MTLDGPVDWERLDRRAAAPPRRPLPGVPPAGRSRPSSPLGMPHWEDDPDFSLDHHLHHADAARARATRPRCRRSSSARCRSRSTAAARCGTSTSSTATTVARSSSRASTTPWPTASRWPRCCSRSPTPSTDDDLVGRRAAHPAPPTRRSRRPPACSRSPAGSPARSPRPVVGRPCAAPCSLLGEIPAALQPVVRRRGAHHRLADRADRRQAAARPQPRLAPQRPARVSPSERSGSEPRPLVDIKLVGRAAGATVNDVLVGAVSAAISHYVIDRGGDPAGPLDDGAGQRPAAASRCRASSATSSPW